MIQKPAESAIDGQSRRVGKRVNEALQHGRLYGGALRIGLTLVSWTPNAA